MKRALVLTALIIACVIGFLSMRGLMPFMPVFGTSMEPALHQGSLIMIEKASPYDIEVGDIIVYNVPSMIQDYYSYPPVVAHRVIKVTDRWTYRTKGDNSGEDPFAVMPGDLRGVVGKQIPNLGFPLLFFQSQQGVIFAAIAIGLLAFYLYAGEISGSGRKVQNGIFAPVIRANRRQNRLIDQRTEHLEKGMEVTQKALEQFAGAIAEYAIHLKSHTSAIQGLSEASQELKKGAAGQNQLLSQLVERMERMSTIPPLMAQPAAEVTPPAVKTETEQPATKVAPPAVKPEEPVSEKPATPKRGRIVIEVEGIDYPPGCFRSRQQSPDSEKEQTPDAS